MTDHDDLLYLVHMQRTAALIQRSVAGQSRQALDDDHLRDATPYRLQTLAESTQRLSSELKVRQPRDPWADIAGFRNRAVHGYLGVSLDIVCHIIERDVPKLAEVARSELDLRGERPSTEHGGDVDMDP